VFCNSLFFFFLRASLFAVRVAFFARYLFVFSLAFGACVCVCIYMYGCLLLCECYQETGISEGEKQQNKTKQNNAEDKEVRVQDENVPIVSREWCVLQRYGQTGKEST
jgi:hypothetical protein